MSTATQASPTPLSLDPAHMSLKRKCVENEEGSPKKRRPSLSVDIPSAAQQDLDDTPTSEVDSLFDSLSPILPPVPASRSAPPIPGLFLAPGLIPAPLAEELEAHYHVLFPPPHPHTNQIMLFERASRPSLPAPLPELLGTLAALLRPALPPAIHALLFTPAPHAARQAILNHYAPGEGIAPHVDLLRRFGDGIVGVGLGGGCVMRFARADTHWDVYLPPRSVIVLTGDARYAWTHGIEGRVRDYVCVDGGDGGVWIERGTRVSITFRWLLPGADVVGDSASDG